jgi:tripartite-type tricarboxylate transporter receptor subunit TctC
MPMNLHDTILSENPLPKDADTIFTYFGSAPKERTKRLPDLPTIAESGWPSYNASAWYGFAVPKGTPPEIVKTLREATVEVINSPQVVPRLELEGAEPVGNTPEEFGTFMKEESARWSALIKKAGLGLE